MLRMNMKCSFDHARMLRQVAENGMLHNFNSVRSRAIKILGIIKNLEFIIIYEILKMVFRPQTEQSELIREPTRLKLFKINFQKFLR